MSVYIKGMEMPTSCAECRFYGEYCYAKGDENKFSNLPCPLIPVPDHGRLVDKDVVCAECRRVAGEYDGIYPDCTYCPINIAPTIIPADKDGEA